MNQRLRNIIGAIKKSGLEAVVVSCPVDITYLTEYKAEDAWLLVTKRKCYYITDSRYKEAVEKSLKGTSIRILKESLYKEVSALSLKLNLKKVGFNPKSLTVFEYNKLKKALPKKTKLISDVDLFNNLRICKDPSEVKKIKKALKIHNESLKYLKKIIKPGVTEKYVLGKLEAFVKSKECGFSFAPIIASGPNSSLPHAKVTNRKIRNNEPVLVDIGIDFQGYKSDLTRMFFLGRISQFLKEAEEAVRGAQLQAISIIRPGIKASEIDKQARKHLKDKKLEKYFGHSLGHGVGLEIHEAPYISSNSNTILKEGMIFTIEPGVYFEGKFGIRIEDMVLVTSEGRKVLSDDIN